MADLGPIVSASILGEVGKDVVGIVESARRRLIKDIEKGIADGLGAAQLADLIESSSAFGSYRSEVIARTETNRALNVAQVQRYKEHGVKLVRVIDGDDDEECRARQARDNGWGPGIYSVAEAANIRDHPNGTMDWAPLVLTQEPRGSTPPQAPSPKTAVETYEDIVQRIAQDTDIGDLAKLDPSIREEFVQVLSELYAANPARFSKVRIGKLSRGVLAETNGESLVLTLSRSGWKPKSPLLYDKSGFLVRGDVRGAVTHEYGHVLQTWIGSQPRGTVAYDAYSRFIDDIDWSMADDISGYAHGNTEGFAEAFVAASEGLRQDNAVVRLVDRLVKEVRP